MYQKVLLRIALKSLLFSYFSLVLTGTNGEQVYKLGRINLACHKSTIHTSLLVVG